MNLITSLIFLTIFGVSLAGIVPNPEHPAKLMARRQLFDAKLNPEENTKEYWRKKGIEFVENQIKTIKENRNKAKNIIFFIGDGMSLATLAASRVYQGDENSALSFEKFPYTGLAKTYCLDRIVPDSASTSTAYLNGVKANYGTIGVNGNVKRKNCNSNIEHYTESIGKWALDAKKSIGFVTTTRVTHASPAGLYAHTADRNWENDSELPEECKTNNITDIAYQLIHGEIGKSITVALGGGRREFRDKTMQGDTPKSQNKRTDGKDLIDEWKKEGDRLNEKRTYVYNRNALLNVDVKKTDRLIGLFDDSHMNYRMLANEIEEPTLEEMTMKAIDLLKHKGTENGYFLFVEGGLIDVAHHGTYAKIAFNETTEFSKAIQKAVEMTENEKEETLIVVSSDHSHTMTIAGYPDRHNNIFADASESDRDDLPFLTINYANGKGADKFMKKNENKRRNPLDKKIFNPSPVEEPKQTFPATFLKDSETHGGEDVAVFATGPWSHLFTGVYEQNVLPHLMAYAACIGNEFISCDDN